MNCPKCNTELEIFAREGKERYVCPLCLAALLPEESTLKVLKYFCNQEIIGRLISSILDDSLFENVKKMLSAEKKLACPKCKSCMQDYDFNKKLRFNVNKCMHCGSIWMNTMQIPLASITFIENNPDDLNFKKSINNLYEALAKKRTRKLRSFDEIIAPYVVMTGLVPAIPLGDNVLTKTQAFATHGIIIACALIFILQFANKEILSSFGLITNRVFVQRELYRLITHAFLHGGIIHLLGNMLFLNIFGRSVEGELGWKKYLLLFTSGIVFSGILFMATTTEKDIPCIGASGAISAVIGAYLILFPKASLRFNVVHPITFQRVAVTQISSLYYILSWIIMNVLFGILQTGSQTAGIAYWGHIGGFIAGIVFAEVYKNFRRV